MDNKKNIKINFVDFWQGVNYFNLHFVKILQENYNPILSDNPDYLFCSCFGNKHFKYKDCIKIFYSGENIACDFNLYDYAMTSHYMTLTDRHIRFPNWIPSDMSKISEMEFGRKKNPDLSNKKFCNFLYSNDYQCAKYREAFFLKLSKYKKVDSGGSVLNNLGYKISNKLDFIKDYKFTIAIENSFVEGYVTEKLSEPLFSDSMPLYYGDPEVGKEFNTNSFVNLRDFKSINEAVEYIVELDNNDKLYLEKFNQPCFVKTNVEKYYREKLINFYHGIFNQEISAAKRTTEYGFVKSYKAAIAPPPPKRHQFFYQKKLKIA